MLSVEISYPARLPTCVTEHLWSSVLKSWINMRLHLLGSSKYIIWPYLKAHSHTKRLVLVEVSKTNAIVNTILATTDCNGLFTVVKILHFLLAEDKFLAGIMMTQANSLSSVLPLVLKEHQTLRYTTTYQSHFVFFGHFIQIQTVTGVLPQLVRPNFDPKLGKS